jgi:maltokinase
MGTSKGAISTIALMRIDNSTLMAQIPLLVMPQRHEATALEPQSEPIGGIDGLLLFDGTNEPEFWRHWTQSATVIPSHEENESQARQRLNQSTSVVKPLGVEQSNTSMLFMGDATHPLIAKVFRVLHCGEHPEVQLPSALGDWQGIPRLNAYSYLHHEALGSGSACSVVVSDAVNDAEDGFTKFVTMARQHEDPRSVATQIGSLIADMHNRLEESFGDEEGPSTERLEHRLNQTLSSALSTAAIPPEEISAIRRTINDVTHTHDDTGEGGKPQAIRIHGDLHLGQLLLGSDGMWNVVDFEGEPLRPIAERCQCDFPARDIAGMLRSFDYAAESSGSFDAAWLDGARTAFMDGYRSHRHVYAAEAQMIRAYELEKALYELQYEAQFRPGWISIPLNGIRRLVRS